MSDETVIVKPSIGRNWQQTPGPFDHILCRCRHCRAKNGSDVPYDITPWLPSREEGRNEPVLVMEYGGVTIRICTTYLEHVIGQLMTAKNVSAHFNDFWLIKALEEVERRMYKDLERKK
jgi:hypothetical protein